MHERYDAEIHVDRVNAFALGGMSLGKEVPDKYIAPSKRVTQPMFLQTYLTGEAWSDYVPPVNKEKAFELLDAWYEAGGVSIDTSNHYQVRHHPMFFSCFLVLFLPGGPQRVGHR